MKYCWIRSFAMVGVMAAMCSCGVTSRLADSEDGANPPVPIGSPVPDFKVEGMDGEIVRLSSLRGRPVLLDFWATWCSPCLESLPHTQELFEKGGSVRLQVLGISKESATTVKSFHATNSYTFPMFIDSWGEANTAFNVDAIPTIVVIDAKGNLVAYLVGADEDAEKAALEKVGVQF